MPQPPPRRRLPVAAGPTRPPRLERVTLLLAVLLLLNAAFNVLVWPTFYRRVAKDPRARDARGRATRFLVVHAVLIGIALLLAAASVIAGVAALVA